MPLIQSRSPGGATETTLAALLAAALTNTQLRATPVPVSGTVGAATSLTRKILDYSTRLDGNPVYVGFNTQAAVVADATWTVYKLFYDASNRLVDQQVAVSVVWTARAAVAWRAASGD